MENGIIELITRLVFQLAVILFAAKIGGEICERYLKQPPVLGELVVGMIIGPYALGGISFLGLGPLFPHLGSIGEQASHIPVSNELYAIAQIGVIVLLFSAGLETDFRQFFKYAGPAGAVALGGVVVPFAFGALATVLFGVADNFMSPEALFIGAIMTATSVGITARVLRDIRRLDTPEGVTILAAAVVDDVLGILVLTIIVATCAGGVFSFSEMGLIGAKAIGFWLGLMGIGILLSKYISRFISSFRTEGAGVALALAVGLFCAGLAESFGLAMVIGAYTIGLALSNTEIARTLERPINSVYHAIVPIFFVVMGMMVDFHAMSNVLVFGAIITVLAIIGKVFGCGLPAMGVGFNQRGAWRIGFGMLPRGEIALIVAGVGLAHGIIQSDLFGVSVMMTMVTTLLAPIVLVPLFRKGGVGRRS